MYALNFRQDKQFWPLFWWGTGYLSQGGGQQKNLQDSKKFLKIKLKKIKKNSKKI